MATLASALKLIPSDAPTIRMARGYLAEMAERANRAATEARASGADVGNDSLYAQGRRRQQEAAALDRAGKFQESEKSYEDALALFAQAFAAVNLTRVSTPSTPPPPKEQPAPNPQTPVGVSAGGRVTTPTPTEPPSNPTAGRPTPAAGGQPAPGSPPVTAAPSPAPSPPPPSNPAPQPQPPPQPPAGAGGVAAEEVAVRQVIERYRTAYENLNVSALQAVYPSINARRLEDVFKQYTSLKQVLEIERVEVDGAAATATGVVTQTPVVKTGKPQTTRQRAVFRLRKVGNAWIIQDVSFR